MPLLDVSDVLDDPDFADTFQVVRNFKTANQRGRTVLTPEPVQNAIGVVQPSSSLNLQRLADGTRSSGSITIWTRYPLSDGDGSEDAHIVFWHNSHWVVRQVDDWSRFGSGYIKAICDLIDLQAAQ